MAYQTEQRLKNLIHQVGGLPQQHGKAQRSSQVFLGRVSAVQGNAIKVERLKESSVAQDGTITWPTGTISGAHIDYVQVYGGDGTHVLADMFRVGQPIWYVPFDGSGANNESIRGTLVTMPQMQQPSVGLVKITGFEEWSGFNIYTGHAAGSCTYNTASQYSSVDPAWETASSIIVNYFPSDNHTLLTDGSGIYPATYLGMSAETTPRKMWAIWAFKTGCAPQ